MSVTQIYRVKFFILSKKWKSWTNFLILKNENLQLQEEIIIKSCLLHENSNLYRASLTSECSINLMQMISSISNK